MGTTSQGSNVANPVVISLVASPEELEAAMAIRFRVFVDEQGVPPEEEKDESDTTAVHAIALLNGLPVGTGRLVPLATGEGQIGRMAVDVTYRNTGIGSLVIQRLEEEARRLGISTAILHAQTYVKAFYLSHGYQEEGDVFLEAGIEHIMMRKKLLYSVNLKL